MHGTVSITVQEPDLEGYGYPDSIVADGSGSRLAPMLSGEIGVSANLLESH